MKSMAATAAVFALGVSSALAADIAVKSPINTVAPAAAPNWNGFYLGVNAGYGWGRGKTSDTFSITPNSIPATPGPIASGNSRFDMNGATAGGQFGYNWQIDKTLLGLEADFNWSGQKGNTSFVCPVPVIGPLTSCNGLLGAGFDGFPPTVAISEKLQWFGTVRARAGALITPATLVYATGGLAYGQIKTDGVFTSYNVHVVNHSTFSQSDVKTGWTAGLGVEQKINGNWSARLEYLYMDLGKVKGSAAETRNFPPLAVTYTSHITDHLFRIGLNYQFGL